MEERAMRAVMPFRRSIAIVFVVATIGAVGEFIKAPWGQLLMSISGHASGETLVDIWLRSGARLGFLMIACVALHRYSPLRTTPVIEAVIFKDRGKAPWRNAVLPPLVVGLVLTALTAIALLLSQVPPLAHDIVSGKLPAGTGAKLLALWPLGFLGAGMSEEVSYRFGMITPVVALICLAFGRDRPWIATAAFWIANIAQAFLFGLGHVQEGIVASAGSAGVILATLTAAQTWMGLLFGYIFKRWGLLSAIVTHALVDLLLPGLLVLWAYLSLAG